MERPDLPTNGTLTAASAVPSLKLVCFAWDNGRRFETKRSLAFLLITGLTLVLSASGASAGPPERVEIPDEAFEDSHRGNEP